MTDPRLTTFGTSRAKSLASRPITDRGRGRLRQMTGARVALMALAALAGFSLGAAIGFYALITTADWREALQPQLIVATVGLGSVVSTLCAVAVAPDRSRRWPSMVVPAVVAAAASAIALTVAEAGAVLLILAALVVSLAVVAGAQGFE